MAEAPHEDVGNENAPRGETEMGPVAFAKFRIWEPLAQGPAQTGIEATTSWLNTLLYAPLYLESLWLRQGFNLPIGQSLLLLARKT